MNRTGMTWVAALVLAVAGLSKADVAVTPYEWGMTGEFHASGYIDWSAHNAQTEVGSDGGVWRFCSLFAFDVASLDLPEGEDAHLNVSTYTTAPNGISGHTINIIASAVGDFQQYGPITTVTHQYEPWVYDATDATKLSQYGHYAGREGNWRHYVVDGVDPEYGEYGHWEYTPTLFPGVQVGSFSFGVAPSERSINVQAAIDAIESNYVLVTLVQDISWQDALAIYRFTNPEYNGLPTGTLLLGASTMSGINPYSGNTITLGREGVYSVPEPATLALLAFGVACCRPRRKQTAACGAYCSENRSVPRVG